MRLLLRPAACALLVLASLTAYGKEKQKMTEKWLDTFSAYPGARVLCSQHVTGNIMHILWTAYVTVDATKDVIAFYVQAEGKERVELEENSVTVRRGDQVLSVHAASAKDYPRCGVEPRREERTVIIVSQAIRPGNKK
jgi:hypothetical protein